MVDHPQETHLLYDGQVIGMFEDNDDFRERLEVLQEVGPDHAAYDPNCIGAAFCRAISRHPLNVPLPLAPTEGRPPSTSERQAKIIEYIRWSRKFPDLPMEVILEIASHLTPLALLHFSRTSKLFRETLMNKASRWMWQGALRTVPGLPPCPDGLNEALYTALVFDRYCFGCGAPDAYSVDYALRLRLCESCWNANVDNATELFDLVLLVVSRFALMLIPSANTFNFKDITRSLTRVNPQTHIHQDLYYEPELRALFDFFSPNHLTAEDITKLTPAFLYRAEDVVRRQMLAVKLYAWERVVGAEGIPNLSLTKATEDQYFISFTFSQGWHMTPYWDEIPNDEDLASIPGPRPDTVVRGAALNADPPKSKAQIATEHRSRADRESAAYNTLLEGRYDELTCWYEQALDGNANVKPDELPNAYDGARLFDALAIMDDARAPIYEETVVDYTADVLARAGTYKLDIRDALAKLLLRGPSCDDYNGGGASVATMLARPSALFVCGFPRCRGDPGYEWDELNRHWRKAHGSESVWRTPIGVSQDRKIRAKFWHEGAEVVNRILDAAGLARDATTMKRLSDLCGEGRLYCACGDPDLETPGAELRWASLVRHVHHHLQMDKCRRPRGGYPWINDHRDLASCIKLLPEGADTSAASARVSAGPQATARIDSFCAIRPEGARLVCSLCAAVMDPAKVAAPDVGPSLSLRRGASGIVYHMQAKHGMEFDGRRITFERDGPPPKQVQVDLWRFCPV